MCEFFVKADPILYESRSRTVRIHGVLTSIRLENMVWDILAEMASAEGKTTNSLISQLHDEILAHRNEVPNFASFLRITCMRYLRRKVDETSASDADHATGEGDRTETANIALKAPAIVTSLISTRSPAAKHVLPMPASAATSTRTQSR
jgi:predicted DNA-binding ribbon-helix-helix protein